MPTVDCSGVAVSALDGDKVVFCVGAWAVWVDGVEVELAPPTASPTIG